MDCQQFLAYTNQSQQVQLSILPLTGKVSTTSTTLTSNLTSTNIDTSQTITRTSSIIATTIQSIITLNRDSDSIKTNLSDFSNETLATTAPVQSSKQIKHVSNSSSLVLPKRFDLTNYATSKDSNFEKKK